MMTHKIAGYISFLLSQEQLIEKEDIDIYQYGLEIFIDSFLEIALLLCIGAIWGRFCQSICFIIAFAVLRSYTGGYHASTKLRCVLFSIVLYGINLETARILQEQHFELLLLLAVFGMGVIWRLAPVSHTNKKLDEEQYVKNRKISRIISLFYLTGIFVLKGVVIEIGDIIGITLFQTAILIIMQRRCAEYEKSVEDSEGCWFKSSQRRS